MRSAIVWYLVLLVSLTTGFLVGSRMMVYTLTEEVEYEINEYIVPGVDISTVIHSLGCPKDTVSSYSDTILRTSKRYGYDWRLIASIIKVESDFNPIAKSNMDAMGLMQVRKSTASIILPKIGVEYVDGRKLYVPSINIDAGTYYLRHLEERFGSIELALVAYNVGPTKVSTMLRDGDTIPMRYVENVLEVYRSISDEDGEG